MSYVDRTEQGMQRVLDAQGGLSAAEPLYHFTIRVIKIYVRKLRRRDASSCWRIASKEEIGWPEVDLVLHPYEDSHPALGHRWCERNDEGLVIMLLLPLSSWKLEICTAGRNTAKHHSAKSRLSSARPVEHAELGGGDGICLGNHTISIQMIPLIIVPNCW